MSAWIFYTWLLSVVGATCALGRPSRARPTLAAMEIKPGGSAQGEEDPSASAPGSVSRAGGAGGVPGQVPPRPLYECGGARHFVLSTEGRCGRCVKSDQCERGFYCCPLMKVCINSSSMRCHLPVAKCRPSCPSRDPLRCSCENTDFPNNWVMCPLSTTTTNEIASPSNATASRKHRRPRSGGYHGSGVGHREQQAGEGFKVGDTVIANGRR